jgi:hypothetical protein
VKSTIFWVFLGGFNASTGTRMMVDNETPFIAALCVIFSAFCVYVATREAVSKTHYINLDEPIQKTTVIRKGDRLHITITPQKPTDEGGR